ncbi:MAG TPA: SAM-dependent methyltransferase [Cyclobacteriaceae bacterium]|nr:SAM-dependent methyltransferase [Cyclobacteriaceae bacterium]
MNRRGKLYLIPTVVATATADKVIPNQVKDALRSIRHFLAEDVRTARRFLSSLKVYESVGPLSFERLDKDTAYDDLPALFQPAFDGHPLGVLSESGCPGIADPGALAARFAHEHEIEVIPLVGPSSILLALMASGLNGQHFAFHGYLPIETRAGARIIRALEKDSTQSGQTHIFIETPYRNNRLLQTFLSTLAAETTLCIAVDLTGASEFIRTRTVGQWHKNPPTLPRLPAIFLFNASGKMQ